MGNEVKDNDFIPLVLKGFGWVKFFRGLRA